jgi:hypothetical protein
MYKMVKIVTIKYVEICTKIKPSQVGFWRSRWSTEVYKSVGLKWWQEEGNRNHNHIY